MNTSVLIEIEDYGMWPNELVGKRFNAIMSSTGKSVTFLESGNERLGHIGGMFWPIKIVEEGDGELDDSVNHPAHYTNDPSGVECLQITRHRNFNIGNAIKYIWRSGLKPDAKLDDAEKQIEDLRKAIFYINDEIERIQNDSK